MGQIKTDNTYLTEIRTFPILTREEEVELIKKSKDGDDEASNMLILSNLRLVVKVARHYLDKGLSFEDLISEGNLGLIHALEKFDHTKGFRFSTYAIWWIKQSIKKAIINKGREIRIPSYKHDMLSKINGTILRYLSENGKYPTPEDISEETGIDIDKVNDVFVEFQDLLSLNANIGDEIALEDVVLEKGTEFIEDKIIEDITSQTIKKMLNILNDREREIIILRYAINGGRPLTLEEVGRKYNITRERVRQIEKSALQKLKKQFKNDIKEYLL